MGTAVVVLCAIDVVAEVCCAGTVAVAWSGGTVKVVPVWGMVVAATRGVATLPLVGLAPMAVDTGTDPGATVEELLVVDAVSMPAGVKSVAADESGRPPGTNVRTAVMTSATDTMNTYTARPTPNRSSRDFMPSNVRGSSRVVTQGTGGVDWLSRSVSRSSDIDINALYTSSGYTMCGFVGSIGGLGSG